MKKHNKISALLLTICMTLLFASVTFAATAKVDEDGTLRVYKSSSYVKNVYGIKAKDAADSNKTKYYRVDKKGVATEVSEVQGLAGIRIESFSKKNLKSAFNWCYKKITYNSSVGSPAKNQKAADYYALRGFKRKKGECLVMASCFYQMAKVLGYDAKLVRGKIKTSTGKSSHAWVTIKQKGKTYVYDPNFAFVFHKRTHVSAAASGYKMRYTKKAGAKLQYTYYTKKGKLLK